MNDQLKIGDKVHNRLSGKEGIIEYLYQNVTSGKMALVKFEDDNETFPVSLKYLSDATKPKFEVGDIITCDLKDYIVLKIAESQYHLVEISKNEVVSFKEVHEYYSKIGAVNVSE